MDIEKLRHKRQLNVQEQNILEKDRIYKEAQYWRKNGIPVGLKSVLKSKGIDIETSIFLEYEQDFPGVSTDEGTVLTKDGEFFEFEMNLNKNRSELLELHVWENKTKNIEINKNKPGTGATWGCLALEVLYELNQC